MEIAAQDPQMRELGALLFVAILVCIYGLISD